MCFDSGAKSYEPSEPFMEDYPAGSAGDTDYQRELNKYWTAKFSPLHTKEDYAKVETEVARGMRKRAEWLQSQAAAARAGPNRPARAIVYDVRATQQALARLRAPSLLSGTLGLPAAGGKNVLLGGG